MCLAHLLLPEQQRAGYHPCAKEDRVHTIKCPEEVSGSPSLLSIPYPFPPHKVRMRETEEITNHFTTNQILNSNLTPTDGT